MLLGRLYLSYGYKFLIVHDNITGDIKTVLLYSVSGLPDSSDVDLASSSDIEDAYAPSVGDDLPGQSSEESEQQRKFNFSVQNEQKHLNSENLVSLLPTEQRFQKEEISKKETESVKSSVSGDNNVKQEPYAGKLLQAADGQFGTSSVQPPSSVGFETKNFAGFGHIFPVPDKPQKDISEQSNSVIFQTSFGSKSTPGLFAFSGPQNAIVTPPQNTPAQLWSSWKGVSPPSFGSGLFPSVKDTQQKQPEQTGTGYVNPPTCIGEKPVQAIETTRASALSNLTPPLGQSQDADEGVEKIDPLPSIRASQLSLQVKSSFEKSSNHQQHKTPLNAGPLRLEHAMSKQPSNVNFSHYSFL